MKILIVTTYMSPIYGGITKVVEETLQALGKQKEITVDLLTTNACNVSSTTFVIPP